ncbi:hypothetical protein Dimus_007054, partial [Dionaea muscipula]
TMRNGVDNPRLERVLSEHEQIEEMEELIEVAVHDAKTETGMDGAKAKGVMT